MPMEYMNEQARLEAMGMGPQTHFAPFPKPTPVEIPVWVNVSVGNGQPMRWCKKMMFPALPFRKLAILIAKPSSDSFVYVHVEHVIFDAVSGHYACYCDCAFPKTFPLADYGWLPGDHFENCESV